MAIPLKTVQEALAGKYQIDTEVGRGAMATVFRGRDEQDREFLLNQAEQKILQRLNIHVLRLPCLLLWSPLKGSGRTISLPAQARTDPDEFFESVQAALTVIFF